MCVRSCKRIKRCVVSFSACRLAWLGRALLWKTSLLAPNGPWVHMLHFREINIHICWKTRRTAPHSQAHGLDSPDSLHFHACEAFFQSFLSLILPKVFFLLSAGSVLATPIKPLYHTTALMDPIRAVQRARQPIWTTARDLCTIVRWQTEEVEWGRGRDKERYMMCWMSWDLSWCTTQYHEEHLLDLWTAPQANAPSLPGVINFNKKKKKHEKGMEAVEEFRSRLKVIFRVTQYCRQCVKLCSFPFKGILRVWHKFSSIDTKKGGQ